MVVKEELEDVVSEVRGLKLFSEAYVYVSVSLAEIL